MDYLDGLNEKQLESVSETEGFVRVIARAGSGKIKALFSASHVFFKILYLAMMDITKKWTGRRQDWSTMQSIKRIP